LIIEWQQNWQHGLPAAGGFRFRRKLFVPCRAGWTEATNIVSADGRCVWHAHNWNLDVVAKHARKPRPSRRLLEHNGKNLFEIGALEELLSEYGPIYLSMFGKLIAP